MKTNMMALESMPNSELYSNEGVTTYNDVNTPSFSDVVSASWEEGMRYSPVNNIVEWGVDRWTNDPNEEKYDPETLNTMYPDLPEKFSTAMSATEAADIYWENKKNIRNKEIIEAGTDDSVVNKIASFAAMSGPAMLDPVNLAVGAGVEALGVAAFGASMLAAPRVASAIASRTASRLATRVAVEGTANTIGNIAVDGVINNPMLRSNLMERETEDYMLNAAIAGFGFPILKEAAFRPIANAVNKMRKYDPDIDLKLAQVVDRQILGDKQINFADAIHHSYANRKMDNIGGFISTPELKYPVNAEIVNSYKNKFPPYREIDIPAYIQAKGNKIEVNLETVLSKLQIEKGAKSVFSAVDKLEIPTKEIPRKAYSIDHAKLKNKEIVIELDWPEVNTKHAILNFDKSLIDLVRKNMDTKELGNVLTPLDLLNTAEGTSAYFELIPHMEVDRFKEHALQESVELHPELEKYSGPAETDIEFEDLVFSFDPQRTNFNVKNKVKKALSKETDLHHDPEITKIAEDKILLDTPVDKKLDEASQFIDKQLHELKNNELMEASHRAELDAIKAEASTLDTAISTLTSCVLKGKK